MAVVGAQPQTLASTETSNPAELRHRVEARLEDLLPKRDGLLARASTSALLGPGKRVRPVLAMLAAEHVGGDPSEALDYGCAVEMVHAASLVLDDLPCMDDATLRRGQPALHLSHGEDAAVLSAVALLNQSNRALLGLPVAPEIRLTLLDLLTEAIGFDGLTEGQMCDLRTDAEGRDAADLRRINHLKTGALFVATVRGGGLIGGASDEQLAALDAFGEAIGFAFQLCDDLQDVVSAPEQLGKDVRQDEGMTTFVDLWGEVRARAAVRQSLSRASDAVGHDAPMALYIRDLFRNAGVGL